MPVHYSDIACYFINDFILRSLFCLVTGSFDGMIRTWHPGNNKPVSSIKSNHCSVLHVVLMSGSGHIIVCGSDRVDIQFVLRKLELHFL